MAGHLARIRAVYAARADALVAALPSALRARRPSGGLFLWADVDATIDATDLTAAALGHGVAVVPAAAFDIDDRPSSSLRLSFASLTPDGLRQAAARLGRALDGLPQAAASTSQSSLMGNASVA